MHYTFMHSLCICHTFFLGLAGEEARLAVTEAYAEQLASQESYHSAALYYLACHKVYDAIDMFKTAGMYRWGLSVTYFPFSGWRVSLSLSRLHTTFIAVINHIVINYLLTQYEVCKGKLIMRFTYHVSRQRVVN